MDPGLAELFTDSVGFHIVERAIASTHLEFRQVKKLPLAQNITQPVFFLRILFRHGPYDQRIVSIQPISQPMGARREQRRVRIRAHRADLLHKAVERLDVSLYRRVLHRAVLENVALENCVERRGVGRCGPRSRGQPGQSDQADPRHSFFSSSLAA